MNIQNISKTDKKVVVELNSDDLINICNALYAVFDKEKGRSRFDGQRFMPVWSFG